MRLEKRLSSEGSSDEDVSVGKDYDVVIIGEIKVIFFFMMNLHK